MACYNGDQKGTRWGSEPLSLRAPLPLLDRSRCSSTVFITLSHSDAHACECLWVRTCIRVWAWGWGGMMETTNHKFTAGLGCKLRAAALQRLHGRRDTFLAFLVWYPPQGKNRGFRLTLTLWGPASLPGVGSPSSWLSDPQPIHLRVLFFVCFVFVFCKYIFLILDVQGSIEILEWGEGADDWVYLFFSFLSWILVFELEKK